VSPNFQAYTLGLLRLCPKKLFDPQIMGGRVEHASPYWKGTLFVYFKEENWVSIETLFSFVQIPKKNYIKEKAN
jgi:hypothetical protein